MSISRRWILGACGVLATCGWLYAAGDRETPAPLHSDQQSALMLAKLASSQKIVDGLVSKDFNQIERGATELVHVCDATDWAARGDQVYAHHRTELRRQAQKLVKMADEKNLDGAAFTYMHSLTTCISCHEYCRDVLKIADNPKSTNKIVPIPVNDDETSSVSERPTRR
ncbi:MAG: hypothetical protein IT428_25125 [Planctomycetaceae bacterium]|nr:hypothetical protein [Planctomycetaceae bacterium]